MDVVATPRRSTLGTAGPQSHEWLTASEFEDIVGVMTDAHEGSGPAPATKVDTNRLHLSPSSREAMNVFVAHQRSSTVFWNAQQGKSGAVYFFGHFYDESAQGEVSEPSLARALGSRKDVPFSDLSARQRRRLSGPPLSPTSEELPDLSLIARPTLSLEQMGTILSAKSTAFRTEDSPQSPSAEESQSVDEAADDRGRWRTVLFTQEGPLRPATETSSSCHRPLTPLKPLIALQLAAGFLELLTVNNLASLEVQTSDMYGEQFTLDAHQVAQAALFHDALQTWSGHRRSLQGRARGPQAGATE